MERGQPLEFHVVILKSVTPVCQPHSSLILTTLLAMATTPFPPPPPLCRFSKTVDHHPLPTLLRPSSRRKGIAVRERRGVSANAAARGNRPPPGVDTRIHWDNEDEGWVGNASDSKLDLEKEQQSLLEEKFADLLNDSSGSHYQFLGVATDADMEEIKSAYRRLSKEYHPDTTSLPLKAASYKFMKLRQVYDVLSDEESRRFYDWTLAQEAASRQAEKMRMKLEDPYIQEIERYVPVPDMVDRLAGKNMELSDQAMTALTFDLVAIIFSLCCIVYALFFKEY